MLYTSELSFGQKLIPTTLALTAAGILLSGCTTKETTIQQINPTEPQPTPTVVTPNPKHSAKSWVEVQQEEKEQINQAQQRAKKLQFTFENGELKTTAPNNFSYLLACGMFDLDQRKILPVEDASGFNTSVIATNYTSSATPFNTATHTDFCNDGQITQQELPEAKQFFANTLAAYLKV